MCNIVDANESRETDDADDVESVDEASDTEKVDDNAEIVFETNEDGAILPVSGYVEDYVNRSQALESFSVWDMTAQLDKIPRYHSGAEDGRPLRKDRRNYLFLPGHRDHKTHAFRVRTLIRVPVPVGPGLPRRDRQETLERHAKVMLILFKPWRSLADLKSHTQGWVESYRHFISQAPSHVQDVINNMQLLHECRDSKDDHFDAMRKARKLAGLVRVNHESIEDDNGIEAQLTDNEIINHLEKIDMIYARSRTEANMGVMECMTSAVNSGLVRRLDHISFDASEDRAIHTLVDSELDGPESKWRKAYVDSMQNRFEAPTPFAQPSTINMKAGVAICAGSRGLFNMSIDVPRLMPGSRIQHTPLEDIIRDVEIEFSLNKEQSRALRIVANHSDEKEPQQLKMFLMGRGVPSIHVGCFYWRSCDPCGRIDSTLSHGFESRQESISKEF
ncbi:hypothetical protein ONZ45_g10876 [Pleurotus djamor]|nr:hypothetical protein ONZ45_g10876 [Pleurotus djamor]